MSLHIEDCRMFNDRDDRLPKGRGDCFDYGIWNGCDDGCPQWQKGKCDVHEENMENMEKFNIHLDIEEFNKIKLKYSN